MLYFYLTVNNKKMKVLYHPLMSRAAYIFWNEHFDIVMQVSCTRSFIIAIKELQLLLSVMIPFISSRYT
jgi:hypothetical protein